MLPVLGQPQRGIDGAFIVQTTVEITFHSGFVAAVEHTQIGGGIAVDLVGGRCREHRPLATVRRSLAVVADGHIIESLKQWFAVLFGDAAQIEVGTHLRGLAGPGILAIHKIRGAGHNGLRVCDGIGEYAVRRVLIEIECGDWRRSRRIAPLTYLPHRLFGNVADGVGRCRSIRRKGHAGHGQQPCREHRHGRHGGYRPFPGFPHGSSPIIVSLGAAHRMRPSDANGSHGFGKERKKNQAMHCDWRRTIRSGCGLLSPSGACLL